MKPKVLFVIDTLNVGGAEKSILEMASFFKTYDPIICSLFSGSALLSDLKYSNLKIIPLATKGRFASLFAFFMLYKLVKSLKPSVIHATLARSELISRCVGKLLKTPVVGTFVSEPYSFARLKHLRWFVRKKIVIFYYLDKLTAKWVTFFTAISGSVLESNANLLNVSRSKIKVIYRGRKDMYDEQNFVPNKIDLPLILLTVNRLVPSKRVQDVIEALYILKQKDGNLPYNYWVVGDGLYKSELMAMSKKLDLSNEIIFWGQQDKTTEFYLRANCFIFPSELEGMGGSVVEAMMFGLPTILSDITVLKEIGNTKTSLFYETGNVKELVAKLTLFANNKNMHREMGKEGRLHYLRNFKVENITHQHEELYNLILSRIDR